MQYERESLSWAERVQHDGECDPDCVRQQRFVLRIGSGRRIVDDRLRQECLERLLAAGPAGPQHVQADPGDDRRQPGLEAVDLIGVGPRQA